MKTTRPPQRGKRKARIERTRQTEGGMEKRKRMESTVDLHLEKKKSVQYYLFCSIQHESDPNGV